MILCADMTLPVEELVRKFFHPAYLVENWHGILDHQLTAPQPNFGPPEKAADDIIILDSDGEEVDLYMPAHNPMRPPNDYTLANYKKKAKRGRPSTRRKRSRGSASAADGAPPHRVGGNVMTQEDQKRQYLKNKEQEFDRL